MHNFIWVSSIKKTNDTIPRKHPDRRKDGQNDRQDRQTLFYRTLLATTGGVQKTCKGNIIMFLVDGRSISRNKTSLNVLVYNVIHLLNFTFEIDKCHNNTWS